MRTFMRQGEAEKIFGEVLRENPGMRGRVMIVTKAGVRRADDPPGSPYHYNLSGEHLVRCVRRLAPTAGRRDD